MARSARVPCEPRDARERRFRLASSGSLRSPLPAPFVAKASRSLHNLDPVRRAAAGRAVRSDCAGISRHGSVLAATRGTVGMALAVVLALVAGSIAGATLALRAFGESTGHLALGTVTIGVQAERPAGRAELYLPLLDWEVVARPFRAPVVGARRGCDREPRPGAGRAALGRRRDRPGRAGARARCRRSCATPWSTRSWSRRSAASPAPRWSAACWRRSPAGGGSRCSACRSASWPLQPDRARRPRPRARRLPRLRASHLPRPRQRAAAAARLLGPADATRRRATRRRTRRRCSAS